MTVSDGSEHGKIAIDVDMLLREYVWDIYRPLRLNGMEYEVTGCDDAPGYGDDDNMLVLLTRKHDGAVFEVVIDVTIRPGREGEPPEDGDDGEPLEIKYAPGRRVRFAHPGNGYPGDGEQAAALLAVGEVYVIAWSDIGFAKSRLGLAGVDDHGQGFNSVLFEPAGDEAGVTP